MNIALDVMGGDYAPEKTVAGAVAAARSYGVTISLVGQPDAIRRELEKHDIAGLDLPIVPASQIIDMADKPARAIREKKDSSLVVACDMVKRCEAQAIVTAGSTGAAMTAGILKIGRVKGIMRPALIVSFPTRAGHCIVLDVGANADTRPEHMQQFAIMGQLYSEEIMGQSRPSICLLNNGAEEGKGNQLTTSAYDLLAQTPQINFLGNIESKEIVAGKADVVVTDGYTGNIFLKTAEATASLVMRVLFEEMTAGPINKVGAFLSRQGFRRAKARLDDDEHGGAVLLGLAGIMIIGHGSSGAYAIQQSIRNAIQNVEHNLPGKIAQGVQP